MSPVKMSVSQYRSWVASKLRKASYLCEESDFDGAESAIAAIVSAEEIRGAGKWAASAMALACENWLDGVGDFPTLGSL